MMLALDEWVNQNLKRSSKAFRALEPPAAGWDPVSRSTLIRGANSEQVLATSFGLTRAGMVWRHSKRAPESNDAQ